MKRNTAHRRYYVPMQNAAGDLRREPDGTIYAVGDNKGWRSTNPRNRLCPCGSGNRFKRCCADKMNPAGQARSLGERSLHGVVLGRIQEE